MQLKAMAEDDLRIGLHDAMAALALLAVVVLTVWLCFADG